MVWQQKQIDIGWEGKRKNQDTKDKIEVLCIGVNEVPGSGLGKLETAEQNASAVAAYFRTLGSRSDVTRLINKDADKTAIINWLKACNTSHGKPNRGKPDQGKTVVLFFSGFSSPVPTAPGSLKNIPGSPSPEWERVLWVNGVNRKDHGGALASCQLKPLKYSGCCPILTTA